jgi:hypothetical protein
MCGASVSPNEISAVEIVTITLYLLGGQTRSIDTEDIALRAAELAPGRFAWRKYPQHIDLQAVRFALENAKRPHCGYVIGTGNEGWMLTETGAYFASKNADQLQTAVSGGQRETQADRKWRRRERSRMLNSAAFAKYSAGRVNEITPQEAAAFFRVDEYVTGQLRERKITRLLSAFQDDSEFGPAVRAIAKLARAEVTDA